MPHELYVLVIFRIYLFTTGVEWVYYYVVSYVVLYGCDHRVYVVEPVLFCVTIQLYFV